MLFLAKKQKKYGRKQTGWLLDGDSGTTALKCQRMAMNGKSYSGLMYLAYTVISTSISSEVFPSSSTSGSHENKN